MIDYNKIMDEVKDLVRKYLNLGRPIGLAISRFRIEVGAYWVLGSNYIVLNQNLVDALNSITIEEREMRDIILVILMHEYLHSLGFQGEEETRQKTREIIGAFYGPESMEYRIAEEGPWGLYPEIKDYPYKIEDSITFQKNFDSESFDYFS